MVLTDLFIGFVVFYLFLWNIPRIGMKRFFPKINVFIHYFGLQYQWGMYANPKPLHCVLKIIIEYVDQSHSTHIVFDGERLSNRQKFLNTRIRKIQSKSFHNSVLLTSVAQYFARQHISDYSKIKDIKIFYLKKDIAWLRGRGCLMQPFKEEPLFSFAEYLETQNVE